MKCKENGYRQEHHTTGDKDLSLYRFKYATTGEGGTDRIANANRPRRGTPNTSSCTGCDRHRMAWFARRTHLTLVVENDFGRVGKILKVHLLHSTGETPVFDDRVEFAVPQPARNIKVC